MVAITSSLSSSSSSYLSLPHLLCPPPFLSLFSLLLKPPRSALLPHAPPLLRLSVPKPSLSLTSIRPIHCLSQSLQPAPETEIDHEFEPESEDEEGLETGEVVKLPRRDWGKLPSLSGKEKKEIASYARSLGKKLKAQSVGKSGVTEAVGIAMVESLEKNELLKIKIHNNCPDELDDAVKQLEKLTGSVVVGQIGRTMILYRPSMTKLKAEEEKKKQAQRNAWRRQQAFRPSSENRGLVPRERGHGRRGSSRFSNPA